MVIFGWRALCVVRRFINKKAALLATVFDVIHLIAADVGSLGVCRAFAHSLRAISARDTGTICARIGWDSLLLRATATEDAAATKILQPSSSDSYLALPATTRV